MMICRFHLPILGLDMSMKWILRLKACPFGYHDPHFTWNGLIPGPIKTSKAYEN